MLGPSAGMLARVFAPGAMKPKPKKQPFGMLPRKMGLTGATGTFNREKPVMSKIPPSGMSKIALPSEGPITAPGGPINRPKLPGTWRTY